MSTLPFPIQFELPKGWRAAPPGEVGVPDAAFTALHPASRNGFTANLTLSGEVRDDDVPLERIADEAARRLEGGAVAMKVGRRSRVGSPASPGFTQAVRMRVRIRGGLTDLVQLQAFLAFADTAGTARQAVLHVVLTATPEQFGPLLEDFRRFLASVRPEQAQRSGAGRHAR